MHKHNHCGCTHNLRHCKYCNVVYCILCHEEWGTRYWNTTWIYGSAGDLSTTGNADFKCSHGG